MVVAAPKMIRDSSVGQNVALLMRKSLVRVQLSELTNIVKGFKLRFGVCKFERSLLCLNAKIAKNPLTIR